MTWKTLRDALEMAAACGFDVDGEDRTAIRSLRPKRAASTKPAAKFTEQLEEDVPVAASHERMDVALPVGRDRRTGEHPQLGHAPAPLVRRSMLTVVMGGRRAGGGGCSPAYRSSPRERANELGLVVHSAASR